jgi:hypothetical protein
MYTNLLKEVFELLTTKESLGDYFYNRLESIEKELVPNKLSWKYNFYDDIKTGLRESRLNVFITDENGRLIQNYEEYVSLV